MQPVISIFYNKQLRAIFYQIVCLLACIAVVWALADNVSSNLARQNITTGFDYLDREANLFITETSIPYQPSDSGWRALAVGIANTLKVALLSIVFGTLIGLVVGVARLSANPLLSRLMLLYVEALRNVPLLLYLLLWYSIIMLTLPPVRQALNPLPFVFLSNGGFIIPQIVWHSGFWPLIGAIVAGFILVLLYRRHALRRRVETGRAMPQWPVLPLAICPLALVLALVDISATLDLPEMGRFRLSGGYQLKPEFAALLIGLTLAASANIAEIVRGGILSIGKGQREAAAALGLPSGRIMRQIILPQALRVIVPPLTNVYLNVIKNSSLAIAIGYPDLVMVSNMIMNQTGQAIEPIALFMIVYLGLSIMVSVIMNIYNARMALVER